MLLPILTYTCSGNSCNLAASTTYHLVFSTEGGSLGWYGWKSTTSNDQTRTPSNNGWSIADNSSFLVNSGTNWSTDSKSGKISVSATLLSPTLAATAVEHDTATLTIANHSGNWYYKANAAPYTSCLSNAVPTTSTSLTSLAGNTSYTFKAYSNSVCSTELAAAAAAR